MSKVTEKKPTKKELVIEAAKDYKNLNDIMQYSNASLGYVKQIIAKAREEGVLPKPKYIEGYDELPSRELEKIVKPIREIYEVTSDDLKKLNERTVDRLEIPLTFDEGQEFKGIYQVKQGVFEILEAVIQAMGNITRREMAWWHAFYGKHNLVFDEYSAQYEPPKYPEIYGAGTVIIRPKISKKEITH